jgi:pilus assembly protein CpaF
MSFQRLSDLANASAGQTGHTNLRPHTGSTIALPPTEPPAMPQNTGMMRPEVPPDVPFAPVALSPTSQAAGTRKNNPFGLQVPPQLVQTVVQRILANFPTNVPLERTPDVEQMLAGRFMAALTGVPGTLPPGGQEWLFDAVMDEILGFGPIEKLLQDDTITEIMINGPEQIWVERKGHPTETGIKFLDDEHVMRVAQRIVAPLGRKLDRKWPMVDARLPDGSRVNIIAPPCALQGTTITIRKFFKTPLTIARLVEFGTITEKMADFLKACVVGKLNIVVAGGTGSGKTTLLNVLSSFIPEGQRILTIEDSAELRLNQRHIVSLEARPADTDGNSAVRIRDLVVNSLRMRPERIVVGEVRGGEALDMLQAMNTGHDGSMTTLHANTPRDALSRLETMVLMAGMELPIRAIREQIASAVDVIVQQARLRDGSRKVIYITEVQGMEGDNIVLQDVFRFREMGSDAEGKVQGRLDPTGLVPKFITRLEDEGQRVDRALFQPNDRF